MREVYHEAGIKGFWKGLIPTLIMVSRLDDQPHCLTSFVTSNFEAKCIDFIILAGMQPINPVYDL